MNAPRLLFLLGHHLGLTALLVAQTPICTIQGSGASSALDGEVHTTTGIITAIHVGPGTIQGYFIEDPTCDASATTSNGLFIYQPNATGISVGQRVQVTGTVDEFQGLTELRSITNVQVLGTGTVAPMDISLPITALNTWERYEGMLLRFPQQLVVTDTRNWIQYGEVMLATERLPFPTEVVDPNDAVAGNTTSSGTSNAAAVSARFALNERSRILLDDGRTSSYPEPPPLLGPQGTLRTGSSVTGLTAVLSYAFDAFRLHPAGAVPLVHASRPTVPEVQGDIRLASLNVLNYFTTLDVWGAVTSAELQRQRTKLVAALQALDADALVLCELENNDVAWADLLAALNAAVGAGTYAVREADASGSGGTKTVLLYKTAVLTAQGSLQALNTSIFQRPHLTQAFVVNSTGARFLLSSVHLRSKLCDNATGLNLDQGDGQGCYNALRRDQVTALLDHWSDVRTSTGIPAQFILGDFNTYAQEDPIDRLRAGGLVELLAENAYSYRFEGTFGRLDHGFGTAPAVAAMAGAGVWNLNSDEPAELDYREENLARYQPGPYRSADHDAVVIGLNSDLINVGIAPVEANDAHMQVRRLAEGLRWTTTDNAPFHVEVYDVQGRLLFTTTPHVVVVTQPLHEIASQVLVWRAVRSDGLPIAQGRVQW
ncbi:MAG: ExeM/NucH family extracellular endonuclease [Flavobacteriales bacterium]|nr:ExeM/NucH family extracellular endonuclease [Flavobacteriales bacterium]